MKKHLHKVKHLNFIKYLKSPTFLSFFVLFAIVVSYNSDYLKTKAAAPAGPYIGGWAWGDSVVGWVSFDCTTGGPTGNNDICLTKPYNVTLNAGDLNGYAWSDNIGWISFNCLTGSATGTTMCGTSNYKVSANLSTGALSGYAWSDNIGWISFNIADMTSCPIADCTPKLSAGASATYNSGFARAIANGGGWDGYISLASTTFNFPASSPIGGGGTVGVCGTATNSLSYPNPTIQPGNPNLCTTTYGYSGLDPVASSSPWKWTCNGTGGGANVNCQTLTPSVSQTLSVTLATTTPTNNLQQGTINNKVTFTSTATLNPTTPITSVYHNIDMIGPMAQQNASWLAIDSNWCPTPTTCGYGKLYSPSASITIPSIVLSTTTPPLTAGYYYVRSAEATSTTGVWVHSNPIEIYVAPVSPPVIPTVTAKQIKVDTGSGLKTCAATDYLWFSCSATANKYSVDFNGTNIFATSSLTSDHTPDSYIANQNGRLTDGRSYKLNCIDTTNNLVGSDNIVCTNALGNNDPKINATTTPSLVTLGSTVRLDYSKSSSDFSTDIGYVNPNNCSVYTNNPDNPLKSNWTLVPNSSITNANKSYTSPAITERTGFKLTCYNSLGIFEKTLYVPLSTEGE